MKAAFYAAAISALTIPFLRSPAGAAAPDDAARAIAALRDAAGCSAWQRLTTMEVAGTHAGDALNGPFRQTFDARDGRYAERWQSGDLTSGGGFDGTSPWERDFSGTTHVMDAPSARAAATTQAWMRARLWCNPQGARYTYLGTAHSKDGAALDVIAARPAGGATMTIFLDRRTHLIDRTSQRYDENTEVTYYSDWRTVAGAALPFAIRYVYPEDNDSETRTISSYQPKPSVDSAAFAPPPTADDVTLPAGADAVTVPYLFDGIKPIVEVRINGKGPFPFVLDTGGHFILTAQTAQRLGLSGRGTVSSVNQHTIRQVGFTRVAAFQIGNAVIHDAVAEIDPYGFTKLERGPRPPKAGWIGLELFERFAVTFDPRDRMLTLRPLAKPRPVPAGTKLPLIFDEDSPLTACSIDRTPGACMLDTGNAGDTIVANRWAGRNGLSQRFAAGLDVDGDRYSRATVAIGPFERPAALVKYDPGADAELFDVEAAVISEALIDGFVATFDYARRGVWLQPAGTYSPAPFNRSGVVAAKRADGSFTVRYIIRGSPASAADVRLGDRILSVDGVPSSHLSGWEFSRANSAAQPSVTFEIRRGSERRRVTIALRDILPAR